ncbi:unnamed protein product [Phyllotreta striolata]|uniref:Uncharacterized protein n=1 Tax=Phyllotreta striolata TaxID=444603 RepID=A0A9N9TKI4_PHYSR|nr:unnamed protein product [Phyllotreta striolata]
MKSTGVILLICLMVINDFVAAEVMNVKEPQENINHTRAKRLSCDLLAIQVAELNVGETLCANLCKLQGKATGSCVDHNCSCKEMA